MSTALQKKNEDSEKGFGPGTVYAMCGTLKNKE